MSRRDEKRPGQPRDRAGRAFSAPASPAAPRPVPTWLLCAGLLAAIFAVYTRVGGFDFIDLDDTLYVTANPRVLGGLTLDSLRWAFSLSSANYFHPLTWVSLMLDASLYGARAGGYHLTNLLLHGANAALLFFLVSRLVGNRWVALAVAGAFGLHPVHVESVAWVTARKDVLFTFFGLVSLHGYAHWARTGRRLGLALSLAAHAASLLAKPMLVTLPGLLLLLDLWPLGRANGEGAWPSPRRVALLILEKWPYLLLGLASGLLTLSSHPVAFSPFEPSLGLRLANALVSYAEYLRLLFLPLNLAILYPFPTSLPAFQVAASALLLTAISGLAAWQWPRRPYLLVGWLWYLMALVPVIVPPKVGLHVALADRWAYLPFWGLYLALAMLAAEFFGAWAQSRGRRAPAILACLLPFAALAALAWHQLGFWKDKYAPYERALAVTRDNYYILNNYGVLMLRKGDLASAERHFRAAHALHPDHSFALANMGQVLSATGRFTEAMAMFERALPGDSLPGGDAHEDHYGIGYCLAQLGRLDEAEAHYRKALELKPGYAMAHNDLGNIAMLRGNLREAEERYSKALELAPDYAIARENLSRVRARLAAGS